MSQFESDTEFAVAFETWGGEEMARRTGVNRRNIMRRRQRVEQRLGRRLVAPIASDGSERRTLAEHPGRVFFTLTDGIILVGSDAHYWPGHITTAHRALCHFATKFGKDLKAIVKNGDALDGASISRHAPLRYEKRPTVKEEIETVQDRLGELATANPRARRFWPFGNHDARFEIRLATQAPEFADVKGFSLREHFPDWEPCWSLWVNDDLVIKHRFKGGIHAAHNATLWSGKSIVNGHLHSLKVTPFTDFRGTRYGVDCGTLADPDGPQFAYIEDNPTNWRSGFIVLTFRDGKLLWPEPVHVLGPGKAEFRGEVIDV